MKKNILALALLLIPIINVAQGYKNPVIPGYHPDPSVCRVGDTFYLVNSTFQNFPAVPIFESKDLAHWKQIGNVLDRESQVSLKNTTGWHGIYAPTIRYNNGIYYMVTTNIGWEYMTEGISHNFFVTATDPAGPWSEPIPLKQQGIDPSFYFEDGKCYFVSNPQSRITLCEIDPKTGEQLTESKVIWDGTGRRGPEGPHIYKKDGWYYLLIAEGGTEMAHCITIARSRDIYGPYESNPANPIFTHCRQAALLNPIQGTGHGDLFQDGDGSWWIVFLGYRTVYGYHHLGRETFLAPVEWKEGEWPIVNGGNPINTEMPDVKLPADYLGEAKAPINTAANGFSDMGFEWLYVQNPDSSKYEHIGSALRLHCSESTLTENNIPTFIGRRQEAMNVTAMSEVDGSGLKAGDEAGISVYQMQMGHFDLALRRDADGGLTVIHRAVVRALIKETEVCKLSGSKAYLRIKSDGYFYTMSVSENGVDYVDTTPLDTPLLSTEVIGGFTGVLLGMYATGTGYADFSFFDYKEGM